MYMSAFVVTTYQRGTWYQYSAKVLRITSTCALAAPDTHFPAMSCASCKLIYANGRRTFVRKANGRAFYGP